MSDGTSLTIIAICQIFLVLAWIGLAIGLIWAVLNLRKVIDKKSNELISRVQPLFEKTEQALIKAQPVLEKTQEVLTKVQPTLEKIADISEQVKNTAEKVSEKVDHIATKAESTVDNVSDKIQTISTRVEQSVTPKIATAAGIASTVAKVIELYRGVNKICGKSSKQEEKASDEADFAQEAESSI